MGEAPEEEKRLWRDDLTGVLPRKNGIPNAQVFNWECIHDSLPTQEAIQHNQPPALPLICSKVLPSQWLARETQDGEYQLRLSPRDGHNRSVRHRDINAQDIQAHDPKEKKELQSLGLKKRLLSLKARRSLVSFRKTVQYTIYFEPVHRSSINLTQQPFTNYRITSLNMKTPVYMTIESRSTLDIGNLKISTF